MLAEWARASGEVLEAEARVGEIPSILFGNQHRPVRLRVGEWTVYGNLWHSKASVARALGGDPLPLIWRASKEPSEPPLVEGPWVEELDGSELESLPVPKFFRGDGGRYLTSAMVIARAPDGHVNVSYHRMMLLGGARAAVRVVEGRHLHRTLSSGARRVLVAVGGSLPLMLAAATSVPWGVGELSVANSLSSAALGRPEGVAEVEGLPAPASSPLVMVASFTGETAEEGPFLDLTWTYDRVRRQPVLEVERILVAGRELYLILPGGPEHKALMGLPRAAHIWGSLREAGIEVVDVSLTEGGCGWLHCAISIRKRREDDGRRALELAFRAHRSLKHAVVVDDDIDISDPRALEWAIATRVQFDRDSLVFRERGSSLDPSSGPEHETCKVGVDATRPLGAGGFDLSFTWENLEKGDTDF